MADNYAILFFTAEEINKILSQINSMKSKDNIVIDKIKETSGDSLELKLQWIVLEDK